MLVCVTLTLNVITTIEPWLCTTIHLTLRDMTAVQSVLKSIEIDDSIDSIINQLLTITDELLPIKEVRNCKTPLQLKRIWIQCSLFVQ